MSIRTVARFVKVAIFLLLCLSGWSVSCPMPVFAGNTGSADPTGPQDEVAAIAQTHLQDYVSKGWAPEWQNVTLGSPQSLANLHGQVFAYLFPVQGLTAPAGYIIVARNQHDEWLVVEFAQAGGDPLDASRQSLQRHTETQGSQAMDGLPIYLGNQQFLWEMASGKDGRAFYDSARGELTALPPDIAAQAKDYLWTPEPASLSGSYTIAGVPEWWQYWDSGWGCYSGCFPTAVAALYGYWDATFPNLIGSDWHAVVSWLQSQPGLKFQCGGNTGWSTWDTTAVLGYASQRGYNFTGHLQADPTDELIIREIDADRPLLFAFRPDPYWTEAHAVIGIGYQNNYLVVRDNWVGKPVATYSTLFRPTHAMTICPPGADCAPQPPALVCPERGGVVLYKNTNFNCANQPEGQGYMRINQSGLQNTTTDFNDQASSIRVPSGWSVQLFEHANGQGGQYCVNQTEIAQFSGLTFNNGVALGENVSSFRVYTQPSCAPSTPNNSTDNTPPTGEYTAPGWGSTVNRVVTLRAQASDVGSGVAKVVFSGSWNGSWRIIGEDTSSPYEFTWDLCAAGIPDGTIQLSLVISDRVGNTYALPVSAQNQITKSYNCSPEPGMWLWGADYWNDKNFGGSRVATTVIGGPYPYLFFFWGSAAPTSGVNNDNWAVRFSQSFYFPGDTYRFHCQHDDGCRIFVDGINLIDAWWDGYGGHDSARYLSPGYHTLTVEYYDNGGDARMEVWWQGAGYLPHDVLPSDASEYSHYWRAEYWVKPEMRDTTPQFTRLEGHTLDHNWGSAGPDPMLPTDNFRAKFTRKANFDCGNYRFTIHADDGVRFTLDGQLLLDRWQDQAATFMLERVMTRGEHDLRIDFYERSGDAGIGLNWQKLSDCNVQLTSQYVSSIYIQPDQEFAPTVRFQVNTGYLDPLRADQLVWTGGSSFGSIYENVRDLVNPGQSYSFDANSPDPFLLSSTDYPEGTYTSQWRARLGSGLGVGPIYNLPVVVDGTAPDIQITSQEQLDSLTRGLVNIQVEASDALSGVEEVEFFAGYANSSGQWSWYRLGSDRSGSGSSGDIWDWTWNTTSLPAQNNIVLAAYAWDRSHNGRFALVDSLRLSSGPLPPGGSRTLFLPLLIKSSSAPPPTPVTVRITSIAGDAELGNLDCSAWSECRNAAVGNFMLTNYPNGSVASAYANGTYTIKRVQLIFNLNLIPAGATIQSARLQVYPNEYLHGDTRLYLVGSTATLPFSDAAYAAIDRSQFVLGSPVANTWLSLTLPTGLRNTLIPGGLARLALIAASDYSNTPPTVNNSIGLLLSESGQYSPVLEVTYVR